MWEVQAPSETRNHKNITKPLQKKSIQGVLLTVTRGDLRLDVVDYRGSCGLEGSRWALHICYTKEGLILGTVPDG